ncbi:hypothetical protein MMC30_000329 [Trapelia coarctata]|nr:hypothetical protein [Trapelia coarctata]
MAHYHLPRRRAYQLITNNPTLSSRPPLQTRFYSAPPVPPPSSRWLSDLKARLGKCIIFGLPKEQIGQAGQAAKILGEEWRGLIAGREGYLIGSGQEGTVRWGEMGITPLLFELIIPIPYLRFAESSRIHWFSGIPPPSSSEEHKQQWLDTCFPRGLGLILKSIQIDFKYPLAFPNHFTIYHRLSHPVSETSSPTRLLFSILLLSTAAQRPAARFEEEDNIFDYRIQKSARLPDHMLAMLRLRWEDQEKAKRVWESRAREVERMIASIENASWNTTGAREDIGGGR